MITMSLRSSGVLKHVNSLQRYEVIYSSFLRGAPLTSAHDQFKDTAEKYDELMGRMEKLQMPNASFRSVIIMRTHRCIIDLTSLYDNLMGITYASTALAASGDKTHRSNYSARHRMKSHYDRNAPGVAL